jgi:hypothetical protein
MVPAGWVRIPVGPQRDATIAEIVARRAVHTPPSLRSQAGARLRQALRTTMDQAEVAGALEVLLLLLDPIRGRTVSASCVISYLPPPAPTPGNAGGAATAADLAVALALDDPDEPHRQTRLAPLDAGMAVRRQYLRSDAAGDPAHEPARRPAGDAVLESLHVDYVIPVPNGDGAHLLLAYSTLTLEVADALTVLFDAMAESLRWVW